MDMIASYFKRFIILISILIIITVLLYSYNQAFSSLFIDVSKNSLFSQVFSNPVSAIVIGLLGSIIVRSSSIVITILAASVAAGLPFTEAIYVLFGANIGTTFQSSVVHIIPNSDKYDKRHIMTITSMNYFNNIIAFCLFFPYKFQLIFLGKAACG